MQTAFAQSAMAWRALGHDRAALRALCGNAVKQQILEQGTINELHQWSQTFDIRKQGQRTGVVCNCRRNRIENWGNPRSRSATHPQRCRSLVVEQSVNRFGLISGLKTPAAKRNVDVSKAVAESAPSLAG